MAKIAEDIKKLREITGAGVMECKKAYADAKGDLDRAIEIIKERGIIKAETKKDRKTGAGLLESYVHNGRVGVLLEIRAETDFVVRSAPFKELSHELVMQIAAMAPQNVDGLLAQPYIKDESVKVKDLIKQLISKVGENIQVERFIRYEL
ncbi:MAG: translation elongation factor Ts [Patescibacteria group bacterium]